MLCQNDSRMTRGWRGLCRDNDRKPAITTAMKAGIEFDLPLEVLSVSPTGLFVYEDWSLSSFARNFHLQEHRQALDVLVFRLKYLQLSVRDVSSTPETDWNDCGAAVQDLQHT